MSSYPIHQSMIGSRHMCDSINKNALLRSYHPLLIAQAIGRQIVEGDEYKDALNDCCDQPADLRDEVAGSLEDGHGARQPTPYECGQRIVLQQETPQCAISAVMTV
jgi:hypothetical protein